MNAVGAALWMKVVLAMEPEPAMVGMFALFHVVYGGVLGGSLAFIPL